MYKILATGLLTIGFASALQAAEFHVATSGKDANPGTQAAPFLTIQHAADIAQPGDVITVHAGTYRERIDPPRGGESDTNRITYRAAPGEKVVITGSEPVKGWVKVSGDTWKVTLPNAYFGSFNPFAKRIYGDWFSGRVHRGCVYLGKDWMDEAGSLGQVMQPAGKIPLWFAQVDGAADDNPQCLMNLASFKVGSGAPIPAVKSSARNGPQAAGCSEGGQCVGFILPGHWLRYDAVDFGTGTDNVEFRAAAPGDRGGEIELRLGSADGELLGACEVGVTGDWQKWQSFTAKIKKTAGVKTLCLVFQPPKPAATSTDNTVIYAQFPGVDPNGQAVEINVRPTVFTPTKTGINYITVRGFILENAATNWASPTEGQEGVITAYWDKGWIIENNEVCHSKCAGITLGKNHDAGDGKNYGTGGFYQTIKDAQTENGWNKANIGSHIVRYNHVHDCEEAGIDGSFGAAYSQIIGNDIHDIYVRRRYDGAEMAGIKFHGGVDVVIKGNHIYRAFRGIWMDWMSQGAQVVGNLFHDNDRLDVDFEVGHGPALIANNILASSASYTLEVNAQSGAYVHNLFAGLVDDCNGDGRATPYFKPHTTETAGMCSANRGDSHYLNNLFLSKKCAWQLMGAASMPMFMDGNVFLNGALPSPLEKDPLVVSNFDPQLKVTEKPDGWYLEMNFDKAWTSQRTRQIATSALLGTAKISGQNFENPDGSPYRIDTDYFGKKRSETNPTPGPFEDPGQGELELRVW